MNLNTKWHPHQEFRRTNVKIAVEKPTEVKKPVKEKVVEEPKEVLENSIPTAESLPEVKNTSPASRKK